MAIPKTIEFLRQLVCNNNKEWFDANKDQYLEAKKEFEQFTASMIKKAQKVDPDIKELDPKKCTFRIYRDVRFSKDKTPYKNNFGAFINAGGKKSPFAGLYLHVEPDASFIAGGSVPNPKILPAIRTAINENPKQFEKILSSAELKKHFGGLQGEQLKRAPKGFDNDAPHVDLLKFKHYALSHKVEDEFWLEKNLEDNIIDLFEVVQPFNAFVNAGLKKHA